VSSSSYSKLMVRTLLISRISCHQKEKGEGSVAFPFSL
jgi:hypothetical protein